MPDHLDLLRRIAESPSGVIAPCTGIRAVHAPMEA